jgi:phospholipid/cholesterol/gamma-HCH transport system substrate-binding protein
LRYGIKESSGGVGADADVRWWGKGLALSVDVFDASFDQYPRVKLAAAFEFLRGVYVLGGIDDALNPSDTLMVQTGATDVPTQFEEYRFGRDAYVGAMIRFNDHDLAALLAIGGGALSGISK